MWLLLSKSIWLRFCRTFSFNSIKTSTYDDFILFKENVGQILNQSDLDNKSEAFKKELMSQIILSIHSKSNKLNEIGNKPIIKRNNNKSVSIRQRSRWWRY